MKLIENNWGKVRCPFCESVMEPDKEDIMTNSDYENYIICPVCDSKIWFEDNHPVIEKILTGIKIHK